MEELSSMMYRANNECVFEKMWSTRTMAWCSEVAPLLAVIRSPVPSPLSAPFEGGIRSRISCARGSTLTKTHPFEAELVQFAGFAVEGRKPRWARALGTV